LIVAGVGLMSGCVGAPLRWSRTVPPMQVRQEQIIVAVARAAPTLLSDASASIARQYGLVRVGHGFPLATIDVHCFVFEVPPGRDADVLIGELSQDPTVQLVQRNAFFEVQTRPHAALHSDPYAELQYAPSLLQVDRAHEVATGRGVRVAVIDTGVDLGHADLRDRVIATRSFIEGGRRSFERDRHGTAVAGVIAASADDGVGIYGIAPEAGLMIAKACWESGNESGPAMCSSWSVSRALDYVIAEGAQVVNLSLGGRREPLVQRLLEEASERSVIIVAAAGASAETPQFPASHRAVLGVLSDSVRPLAPAGPGRPLHAPDLLRAPGEEILTTQPGNRHAFESGSSLAAAHVSGLVALMLELSPSLTTERVRALLVPPRLGGRSGAPEEAIDVCRAFDEIGVGRSCP